MHMKIRHGKIISAIIMLVAVFVLMPSAVGVQPKQPFIWPIEGEVVTGFREAYWDQDRQRYRKHTGIDIKAKPGTRVKASANGLVSYIGISPTGGLTLVLQHNRSIKTTYLNLQYVTVSRGDVVLQGQHIAAIGATDDPSHPGVHLHFGTVYNGAYLNPEHLLAIDYSSISRFIYLQHFQNDYSLIHAPVSWHFPF